jgi:hypothetical protein
MPAPLLSASASKFCATWLTTPEYDEPQTIGELTFFVAQQGRTGKSVVTARFNANPAIFT